MCTRDRWIVSIEPVYFYMKSAVFNLLIYKRKKKNKKRVKEVSKSLILKLNK